MDKKSALTLGVCLIIASLVVTLVPQLQTEPQTGRFQMYGVPSHAYVVDTTTGEVWQDFATANSGSSDKDFSRKKLKTE